MPRVFKTIVIHSNVQKNPRRKTSWWANWNDVISPQQTHNKNFALLSSRSSDKKKQNNQFNETKLAVTISISTERESYSFGRDMCINGSLIPETSAHFNRLLRTSSNPRVTASELTINAAEYCNGYCWILSWQHWIKVITNFSGNQLPINCKRLIGLKLIFNKHSTSANWIWDCR